MISRAPALALLPLSLLVALSGCSPAAPPPPAPPVAASSVASAPPPPPPACESTAACLPKCEAGDKESCRRFSDMVAGHKGPAGERERARKAFDVACEDGSFSACTLEGKALLASKGAAEHDKGTALLTRACDGGQGEACDELARLHEHGFGMPSQPARALELYDLGCFKGHFPACAHLGRMHQNGSSSMPPDPAKADAAFKMVREKGEAACQAGEASACVAAGHVWSEEHGGVQDVPRGASLLHKGCELGDLEACSAAAHAFSSAPSARDEKRATEDYQKVFEAKKQGCEMGSYAACGEVARMYSAGHGTAKDPAKSLEIHQQSCEKGYAPSCFIVGERLRDGDGVPKDPARAGEMLTQACTKASALERSYCSVAGRSFARGLGVARDEARAASVLKAGCDLGDHAGSCLALARMERDGRGVAKDPSAAAAVLRHSCDHGAFAACDELGHMLLAGSGVPKDLPAAASLYKKACDSGLADACVSEGVMSERGLAGAKDQARAEELYKKACDRGSPNGCYFLAMLQEHPARKGDRPDLKAVAGLYERACSHGGKQPCEARAALDESGKIGPRDPTHAISMRKQACLHGAGQSCLKGRGKAAQLVDPDDKHLASTLEQDAASCRKAEPGRASSEQMFACMRAGYFLEEGLSVEGGKVASKAKDQAGADELYAHGCELGSPHACAHRGYALARDKKASAADKEEGVEMLRRSCFVRMDFACAKLKELRVKE